MSTSAKNPARAALLGLAAGDALGVPVEFRPRQELDRDPVTDLRGFGTHHQPAGTWSDDTSLTLCLAESLLTGFDLADMARRFVRWREEAYWTAHGQVFDIGMQTQRAIGVLRDLLAGGHGDQLDELRDEADPYSNGNGSLMRILPLLFYLKGQPIAGQFELIWLVSALTHGHVRSALACTFYLRLAEYLLSGLSKSEAYLRARTDLAGLFHEARIPAEEQVHFARLVQYDVRELPREEIESDGYVIHSLEAAVWCFLRQDDYPSTVLAAVNLGEDTDTTAAIAGGLAGLYYGEEAIPAAWRAQLARRADIERLGDALWERSARL